MARMRKQVPLAVRVTPEQNEWLAHESMARNIERSAFVRELFELSRTCFGLPPADRDVLESEAARQRLEMRRFIGEVLRDKARELRTEIRGTGDETTASARPVRATANSGSDP